MFTEKGLLMLRLKNHSSGDLRLLFMASRAENLNFEVFWQQKFELASQNSQAEWVRVPVGPHLMSVMTRGRGLD